MPIKTKDLGKYKAPSIYIEEVDNSIRELPIQEVLINLVPGFSKKGPINTPVYIEDPVTFRQVYGDIDRNLENKASYFHRTCLKMLESGPIHALNLLATSPTRDTLQWKSISLQAKVDNAATQTAPYENFFNRQDFWERDDESFLDIVNNPTTDSDRLLHLTNMGDKTVTAFMFKSSISGFDITAEDWYGGIVNVPGWLNKNDWMSDYIVTILIVQSDWTNYNELSVDPTWGKYFSSTGLDKTKVQSFVNETNVSVLGNYDVSLIPYFKDTEGKDMYIKTVLNNNTDTTGLFSAFYEDGVMNSDYPIGKVDLLGDGLVNNTKSAIDFLSYNTSIMEIKTYEEKQLDSANNSFGNYSRVLTDDYGANNRNAAWTNYYTSGIQLTAPAASNTILFDVVEIVNTDTINVSGVTGEFPTDGTPIYFTKSFEGYSETITEDTFYYVQNGVAGVSFTISKDEAGLEPVQLASGATVTDVTVVQHSTTFDATSSDYFVINGVKTYFSGTTYTVYHEPMSGIYYPYDTYSRYDVFYLSKGDNSVHVYKGTTAQSTTATKPDFPTDSSGLLGDNLILGYSLITYSNPYSAATLNSYTPVTIDTAGYIQLSGITLSSGVTGLDNYLGLTFENTGGVTDASNYQKLLYRSIYNDIESGLDDGKGVIIKATGEKLSILTVQSGDYSSSSNAWIKIYTGTEQPWDYTISGGTLLYYVDDEFVIDESLATTGLITSTLPLATLVAASGTGIAAEYSDFYLDYQNGIINAMDYFFVNNNTGLTQVYLDMFIDADSNLSCEFLDIDKISPKSISGWLTNYGSEMLVHSNTSNWKQTVEIEYVDATDLANNNVWTIKVDKTRYSEVIKGNFLEAYYDESEYDTGGSKYGQTPKKLTRIINTTIDSSNTNWKVISCDAPIKITNKGTSTVPEYQTTTYYSVDQYVDYYQGVKLDPFVVSTQSVPDGTEARMNTILDVLSTTTNLGKALADKNKISWRYLIDSFGLGLQADSKSQYADLCGLKLNCLGFINMPSVKQLKKSSDPSFVDDTYALSTEYLMKGADETKNPSFYYSFADGDGAACVGYFFPYVRIDDEGVPKYVPPAAYAATTYMYKHTTSNAGVAPWSIAAGIDLGKVNGIGGTEMDFNFEDLENLSQMGANPIVYKKDRGYCINDENTGKIYPYSSLSLIHTREVLIELENRLYDMLLKYQWKFNTDEIRSEIKFRADKICKEIADANGLYAFRNIMDTSNNTNYIIDLQMGVLDTYVEVVKGMGIIVNNITILKKGDIESGGFI